MQKQFTGNPFSFSLTEFSGSLTGLGVILSLMLGTIFLLLGLLGGSASMQIFELIPFPVLGVLLAYVGFQYMLLTLGLRGAQASLTALLVLVMTLWTNNLAIGFISAAVFYHLWNWLAGRFLSND